MCIRDSDGTIRWLNINAQLIIWDDLPANLSFIADVTHMKKVEEDLRKNEQLLADIIDFLPDATFAIDEEKRIIIWNRATESITGVIAQEMIGKGDKEYAVPFYGERRPLLLDLLSDCNDNFRALYTNFRREGDALVAETFCHALHQGRGAWVFAKAAPLKDQAGNIKGAIEIIRDITEQKLREEALKDYQRNLADIINFLPDATFVIDRQGVVTAWNRAMESLTGVKEEDMVGKGNYEYAIPFYGTRRPLLIDLVLNEDEPFMRASYENIHHGVSFLSGEAFVQEVLGGKGAYLWGHASRLYNAKGEVIGAIQSIRNITDRKQAEQERQALSERLQRAEKMEALGLLAGGVAHDLNNVLGVVVGYAEMVKDELPPASTLYHDVEKILEAAQQSAAIVQDLLALARRGLQTRKVVNLNEIINKFLETPEWEKALSTYPAVRVEVDLETDLLNILGSPVHLRKSLVNLVNNALESMPTKGGLLALRTRNTYLDRPIRGYEEIREGDYVMLEIMDTGVGIAEHDLQRIFEPFYTKKMMGRSGTGLGLAVVWGTVKDHNGYIQVTSAEGQGSTFSLYFPVARETDEDDSATVSRSSYKGKGERILVVDDVKGQRELAARMIEKLNYRVYTV
ncbi:MAG: PAS domain S-box protein, partial [Syntrophales bacterium]|nr:PAS domain S-box protein [Syntrophales bacterium]